MSEPLFTIFSPLFYRTCLLGLAKMPLETRNVLARTVTEYQGPGGLFCGREGWSRREDLYYTLFGLTLALLTRAKIDRKACADGMKAIDFSRLDFTHGCVWLRIGRLLELFALPKFMRKAVTTTPRLRPLPPLPSPEDGDAPYSRFLRATLYADFGRGKALAEASPAEYRLPGGLFGNRKNPTSYGVNATSAAIFLLPENERLETARALAALQEPAGFFRANEGAADGDLLSTATACFALRACGVPMKFSPKSFLRECFRENGLFAADPNDPTGDLEYAVYGLLTMGVLA